MPVFRNTLLGVFSQRASDGAIVMDMYDYQTNQTISEFHKVVTAAGTLTH
ncbi:MAG TPA: hypothetical protein VIY73_24070 [Polyangiaceae bacterium]